MKVLEYRNEGERVNSFVSNDEAKLLDKMIKFCEAMGYDKEYINDLVNTLKSVGSVSDDETGDEWMLYEAKLIN